MTCERRLERAIGKGEWKPRMEEPIGRGARPFQSLSPFAFSNRSRHSQFPFAFQRLLARIIQPLRINHAIISRRVKIPEHRRLDVPPRLVKTTRRRIVTARRRLDHDQSRFPLPQPPLDFVEQLRTAALALKIRMDRDPVEIVGAIRSRCRAIADVSDELTLARERPDKLVIRHAVARIVRRAGRSRREGLVEQLERDRDLVVAKDGCRVENLTNAIAMAPHEGPELYLHSTHSCAAGNSSYSGRGVSTPESDCAS